MSLEAQRLSPQDYPRSPEQPLASVKHTDRNAAELEVRRARWAPYLTTAQATEAPLATRFVPRLLANLSAEATPTRAWPATLYPAGYRRQVLAHTAWPDDAIRFDVDGSTDGGSPARDRIATLRASASELDAARSVALASLFNVMSLYRSTIEVFGRRSGRGERPSNPHLLYELARAAYQLKPGAEQPIRAFTALATDASVSSALRLNASSRLIAHFARRQIDLEQCGEWTRHGLDLAREVARRETGFDETLGFSRVHRAAALYAMRCRDVDELVERMRETAETSARAAQLARDETDRLAAAQDERLVLEATLKAFVGSRGTCAPLPAHAAAARLFELDPVDPYSRLVGGDALWMLGRADEAIESYGIAASMGTFPGALAAHRTSVVLCSLGRAKESEAFFAAAVELDPAAAATPPASVVGSGASA